MLSLKFITLVMLVSSLAAADALVCRETFLGLVGQLRTRLRPLDQKLTLDLNGKPFVADRVLGRRTAEVLLSEDGKEIVKLYDRGSLDANFEYWASRFLAEKGMRVTKCHGPPVTLPDGRVALRKEYTAGLTWRELRAQGLARDKIEKIGEALDKVVLDYSNLFTGGEFVKWLDAQGHTPASLGIDPQRARTGDMDSSNVLYTFDGWTVIDP